MTKNKHKKRSKNKHKIVKRSAQMALLHRKLLQKKLETGNNEEIKENFENFSKNGKEGFVFPLSHPPLMVSDGPKVKVIDDKVKK